ncbi:hypothetical protein Lepto7375DRAFT_1209 [Leptolyngbya sp. PCC 7375]|nr:hypothetical protein Lepto7375DRAFT_1209 [Leptolyngbya sp. PCC 7375]
MTNAYDQDFFSALQKGAKLSAQEIIPLVLDLVEVKSVVDVGCGDGTWLSVFKDYGIHSYLGIDGAYITDIQLNIPQENIVLWDLSTPLQLNHTFDLVMSLEVAEHLPQSAASTFVESLTSLGSVILFSAAIPSQGGTEHLNEQWPEYWVDLFQSQDYIVIDCLRKKIWDNDKVEPWYAQNILFFVKQECLENFPTLASKEAQCSSKQLSLVHPKIYLSNLIYPKEYPASVDKFTSSGAKLSINNNRFGYLDLEIIDICFFSSLDDKRGEALHVEISYRANKAIYSPIFCAYILWAEDDSVYYEANTQSQNISVGLLHGEGKITLSLEQLQLQQGSYFIDIGVFERYWSYLYDYHWHVYPLKIEASAQ